MAHWHGGLFPLMKLDLGKGFHLLSRSQLFKRYLGNSTLFIKCLGEGAVPRGPTPYPLYTIFYVKGNPFTYLPSSRKMLWPLHYSVGVDLCQWMELSIVWTKRSTWWAFYPFQLKLNYKHWSWLAGLGNTAIPLRFLKNTLASLGLISVIPLSIWWQQ